jgi:hypothetical protein
VPVFEQVSYTQFMVERLTELGISNFVLCDNASFLYPVMRKYLERASKNFRVCNLGANFWSTNLF